MKSLACILRLFVILMFLFPHFSKINAQRGKDIIDKMIKVHSSRPEETIRTMDSLREAKVADEFVLDMEQSAMHNELAQYQLSIVYGERAFATKAVQNNIDYFTRQATILSKAHLAVSNFATATRYALAVIDAKEKIAPKKRARVLSDVMFLLGQIHLKMDDKASASDYFTQCIHALQSSNQARELASLSFFLGEMTTMLIDENCFREALEYCLQREAVIAKIDRVGGAPEGYTDQQYAYLYSKEAYVYQLMGDAAKALSAYHKFIGTSASKQPFQSQFIAPYLMLVKEYQKALALLEPNIMQFGDTINAGTRMLFCQIADCYAALGNKNQAYNYEKRAITITDSIHIREKSRETIELNILHETQKHKIEIIEQKNQLLKLRLWSIALAIILFSGVVIALILWNNRRKQGRRKKIIFRQIKEQELLESKLRQVKTEEQLFGRLTNLMNEESLFINPKLGRDDLARALNTNSAYLSQAIKENTNMTVHTYLTTLRLNKVQQLITQANGQLNLEEIALNSGFGSASTLYRQFKMTYDLTPSEYYKLSTADSSCME